MVPEIHHSLLASSFVSAGESSQHSHKSNSLFDAIKALYFLEMHSLIMRSWKSFHDSLEESAKRKEELHEELTRRKMVLKTVEREASKRHIEEYDAANVQIWTGPEDISSRHLSTPV